MTNEQKEIDNIKIISETTSDIKNFTRYNKLKNKLKKLDNDTDFISVDIKSWKEISKDFINRLMRDIPYINKKYNIIVETNKDMTNDKYLINTMDKFNNDKIISHDLYIDINKSKDKKDQYSIVAYHGNDIFKSMKKIISISILDVKISRNAICITINKDDLNNILSSSYRKIELDLMGVTVTDRITKDVSMSPLYGFEIIDIGEGKINLIY